MIVRELVARLGLDFDGTGFARAEKAISGISSRITSLAGLSAVWAGLAVSAGIATVQAVDQADALKDLSDQVGASTTAIQQLGYAATLTGSSSESMNTGLAVLNRTIGEALTGNEEAAKSFNKLGIVLRDSNGSVRSTGDVVFDIANKMKDVGSAAERSSLAMDFFGREGRKLGPVMALGADGLRELGNEAIATGAVFDDHFIDSAIQVKDIMDRTNARFIGVRNSIANAFMPVMLRASKAFDAFFKAAQPTVLSLFDSAVRLVATPVRILGDVIGWMSDQVSQLADELGPLTNLFAGVLVMCALLAAAFLSPGIALFLLGALITAIVEDFYTFLDGGESVIGDLLKSFGNFVGEIGEIFVGIGNTIADFWTNTIMPPINAFFDWADAKIGAFADAIKGLILSIPGASLIAGGISAVGSLIGGGAASPAADAAQRASSTVAANESTVVAPTNNTQITVNAAPGQSTEEVGKAVQERFSDHVDEMVEQAYAALAPAVR